MRAHLAQRGASFWSDLRAAATDVTDAELLAALWDLVWAGEVTNDSLVPMRALLSGKPKRTAPKTARPRPGRLTRIGPPAGAGRWSLVSWLAEARASATEVAHASALQLLERNGVLTREAALAEGVEGGFAGVYPVLKALEERGHLRRGYFVAGLGATQFALPGAVDRLRAQREGSEAPKAVVLAATDPAQVYGASLPWPDSSGRPARAAGSMVVLVDGLAVAYLDRGGRSLLTFAGALERRPVGRHPRRHREGRSGALARAPPHRRRARVHLARRADAARRRLRRRLSRSRPPVVIHRSRARICCPEGDGSEPPGLHAPDA